MKVIQIDDKNAELWDAYVQSRPAASIYHAYHWRGYFADYFGKETHYLAAVDSDDNFVGVLPLVRLKSVFFGDFFVSLPFVNYGGIVANDPSVAEMLSDAAGEISKNAGSSHLELRHSEQELPLPSRTDKVAMVLELPASIDELGASIGSKRRSQVRRSQREDPLVRIGANDLLDDFYAVFCRNMRDLGTPVYGKSMFRYLLQKFPNNSKIVSVRIGDVPAAAAFLIFDEHRVEIPWASTVREFNRISVNMLLYWEVLSYAIENGKKTFDFGRSTIGSGTHRFKQQWGAKPVQLNWHYWLAEEGELPKLNPDNAKFRLAIQAWQKLPLRIANWLGPHIVKHLP